MLSISNVKAAQASKYFSKDDYYTRDEGGKWFGLQKSQMDLPDLVEKDTFDRFLQDRPKRAGVDLTFSVPKSVSLAMVMDESLRNQITAAHEKAVDRVLGMIEKNEICARVTKNHITAKEYTGNMLAAKFNHYVSRSQDPQLHTHCVILNRTKCSDGKIRALDNPNLYYSKMYYGQIYRNELALNLRQLGYDITVTNVDKGIFELKGVTRSQIEFFSKRRMEIEEALKSSFENDAKAAERVALLTRKAKEHKDFSLLMESWKETANDLGVSIKQSNIPYESTPSNYEKMNHEFLLASKDIGTKTFAFDKKEYSQWLLKYGLGYGATIKEAEDYFKDQLRKGEIFYLGNRTERDFFCTKEGYEVERKIFDGIEQGKNQVKGLTIDSIDPFIQKSTLKEEQENAIKHICTSQDRFIAIQGLAGTGKTHTLKTAKSIFENEGFEVKGICPTGRAATNLQQNAEIQSSTIHSFLNKLEKEAGNLDLTNPAEKNGWDFTGLKPGDKNQVWLVDEASMIGNAEMAKVIEAAQIKNAKVVFVGDHRQMLPVGAGNSYGKLIENHKIDYVVLKEIRRQENQNIKDAVYEAVIGDIKKSVEYLNSSIKQIPMREKRFNAIAEDFTKLSYKERENTYILTGSNGDRREINSQVREKLKEIGELNNGIKLSVNSGQGYAENKEFAPGERIVFLRNDKQVGVMNGDFGYVKKIDGNKLTVVSNHQTLTVDTELYKNIDYGYCATTHKFQGGKSPRIYIHLDTEQGALNSRNKWYVDISRAVNEVAIYTDNKKELTKSIDKFQQKLTSEDFGPITKPTENELAFIFKNSSEELKMPDLDGLDGIEKTRSLRRG